MGEHLGKTGTRKTEKIRDYNLKMNRTDAGGWDYRWTELV
jgi:hypothetical protein